jgi:cytoskeletal protein CcmA (bactofilin family)
MKRLAFVFLLAFFVPIGVFGAQFAQDPQYSFRAGEVIDDDLYVAGGNVTIAGDVTGDILMMGGNILVSGVIGGDLMVAGGSVSVVGDVGGDVRAAGGNIIIGGTVQEDVVAIGGQVHIVSGARVLGDVTAPGGVVILEGMVLGNVLVRGGEAVFDDVVEGSVDVKAGKVTVKSNARIFGDFVYEAPEEAMFEDSAVVEGEITFTQQGKAFPVKKDRFSLPTFFATIFGLWVGFKFATLLIAAFVLVYMFKRLTRRVARQAMSSFGKSFLYGIIFMIVAPVVSIVLFVTLLGVPLGILVMMLTIFTTVLGVLYGAVVLGLWIERVFLKKKAFDVDWKTILFGVIAVMIVGFIPFVGWIVKAIFMLTAVGALAHLWHLLAWSKQS